MTAQTCASTLAANLDRPAPCVFCHRKVRVRAIDLARRVSSFPLPAAEATVASALTSRWAVVTASWICSTESLVVWAQARSASVTVRCTVTSAATDLAAPLPTFRLARTSRGASGLPSGRASCRDLLFLLDLLALDRDDPEPFLPSSTI